MALSPGRAPAARAAWVLVTLALAACGPDQKPAATATTQTGGGRERISATAAAHLGRTYDELLKTLEENYVYGPRRSVDWSALRGRYRGRIASVSGVAEFATVVRATLEEIGDPDVLWQSRDERIAAELSFSTRYEGIGTYIGFRREPTPRVLILEVIPGSPAERAGLRPHDAITAIEGTAVGPDEALTVAQRIRGPRGTPVRLEVVRPGGGRTLLSVTRDRVELSGVVYPARSGMVEGTSVGYILFPRSASEDLAEEIPAAIARLGGVRPLRGLILDLRISGSGAFPLYELLGLFTSGEQGTSYTVAGEEVLQVEAADRDGSQSLPLAVIVGPDTEGLAEIFAAALRDRGEAVIVGRATPGSVERDQQFGLVDGSRLWLPVWSYRSPDGREIGLEGVVPDVAVAVDWDGVTETADAVRAAAARVLLGARP